MTPAMMAPSSGRKTMATYMPPLAPFHACFPGAAQHHKRVHARLARAMVVRCRPGIVTDSEPGAVPDQRCTVSRCTASGKQVLNHLPTRCALLQERANALLRRICRHDIAEILDRLRDPAPIVVLAHEGRAGRAHDKWRFLGEGRRQHF